MFTQRSEEQELLDLGTNYYTQDEYGQCLNKLFLVNKILGFFKGTIKIIQKFPKNSSVLDIGCGGGLFILHLSKIFPGMKMIGLDINKDAILQAEKTLSMWKEKNPNLCVSFLFQEQPELNFPNESYDLILATLVCHHLTDNELIKFFVKVQQVSKKVVIINDLHRHFLAEWLFAFISPILFRNRLITHDGKISIRRGFKRSELKLLLDKANIKDYQIKWCFPFRWRILLWKNIISS